MFNYLQIYNNFLKKEDEFMRKSIKKIWAVALAATMTVGLAACGNDSQGESSKAEQQESMASSGESM